MPRVIVTRDVVVRANDLANVFYPKNFIGSVPKHHLEQIERAGAGREAEDRGR